MTTTQELLESSFELNLSNYGPEDVERLNDWAINAYRALEALQAEVFALTGEVANKAEYAACMYRMHADAKLERDAALAGLAELEPLVAALLHQIEISDFVDRHGHSAKMLCAVFDLKKIKG